MDIDTNGWLAIAGKREIPKRISWETCFALQTGATDFLMVVFLRAIFEHLALFSAPAFSGSMFSLRAPFCNSLLHCCLTVPMGCVSVVNSPVVRCFIQMLRW